MISKYGYCVLVVKHTHEAVCVLMRMRVCVYLEVLTCTYMYRSGMLVWKVLSLGNVRGKLFLIVKAVKSLN